MEHRSFVRLTFAGNDASFQITFRMNNHGNGNEFSDRLRVEINFNLFCHILTISSNSSEISLLECFLQ